MFENKEKLEKEVNASEKILDKGHAAMNVDRNANRQKEMRLKRQQSRVIEQQLKPLSRTHQRNRTNKELMKKTQEHLGMRSQKRQKKTHEQEELVENYEKTLLKK